MHRHNIKPWQHQHKTHSENRTAERNTIRVMWLTLVMMVIEILAGWLTGSMALLADGWHMGTHFFALGIAAFAYWFARKNAHNRSFSFGTGKVDILGGYSSAVVLAFVALLMAAESVARFFSPEPIRFNEALLVAVVGLIVNLVSALLLNGRSPGHEHSASGHHHPHQDHNLKAAYLHVLADALTSVFAIIALLAGKFMGWVWLDPAMGVVGALVISRWAYGLLRDTSSILLDREGDGQMTKTIHTIIEADADNQVADLHLWRLSDQKFALILSVVTHYPQPPEYYKGLLQDLSRLEHITVEVHQPVSQPCSESLRAG